MSRQHISENPSERFGNRPIRFGTRHILYLSTVLCVLMGIPGGLYVVGVIVAPWVWFLFIIGPLIFLQLLFILLIPPLRRRLLQRGSSLSDSLPQETRETTPATDA
jgi:hypothetical protein